MNALTARMIGVLAALAMLTPCALAQETMEIFVSRGAATAQQARQIALLLEGETEICWTLTMEQDESLKQRVLAGRAPDLAVCPPGQALPYAREGMLLALQTRIGRQTRIQRQVLGSCVHGEMLFMAPLAARHRQMAVNTALFEQTGLGYMLDRESSPVWFPAQFYQIMEEFMMRGRTTLDIWRPEPASSAAIEALTQAIFGGMLMDENAEGFAADSPDLCGGVRWLSDAVDAQMIGYCESRADALERFLAEETAIFIDWTAEEDGIWREKMEESGMETMLMPYPAAVGTQVRSFELTGVCAFAGGDAVREAGLLAAVELLDMQAESIFGARGIWQDEAVWLWDPGAHPYGATLRSLYCEALERVLEEGADAQAALGGVQAAMETMK